MNFNGFGGGHQSVGTALILNGLRWQDTDFGGWLSQDPTGFRGGDTNLTRCVANNPTNAIDPTRRDANSLQNNTLYHKQLSWHRPEQCDSGGAGTARSAISRRADCGWWA